MPLVGFWPFTLALMAIAAFASEDSRYCGYGVDLKIPDDYDRTVRPAFQGNQGEADEVQFGMFIHSVGPVEESKMTVMVDMYFRQYWQDPRLAQVYRSVTNSTSGNGTVALGKDYLQAIWKPDIFWIDSLEVTQPGAISNSLFLILDQDGNIFYSTRLLLLQRCQINLRYFPFDRQECRLCFESYQYHDGLQKMSWISNKVDITENQITANFLIEKDIGVQSNIKSYGIDLDYTSLCVTINMKRKVDIYIINLFLPSISLVVLSWVGFWIDKRAVPARSGLSITTVLAQITLMIGTAEKFPGIADLKMADLYLIINFFYVFASLVEFAVVSYVAPEKKIAKSWLENVRARRAKVGSSSRPHSPPKLNLKTDVTFKKPATAPPKDPSAPVPSLDMPNDNSAIIEQNELTRRLATLSEKTDNRMDEDKQPPLGTSEAAAAGKGAGIMPLFHRHNPAVSHSSDEHSERQKPGWTHVVRVWLRHHLSREYWKTENADLISKWLFPLTFTIWHVVYFTINLKLSGRM